MSGNDMPEAVPWRAALCLAVTGTLRLASINEDHSTYLDRDDNEVHLQHGTGRVLEDLDVLDLEAAWARFNTGGGAEMLGDFRVWLSDQVTVSQGVVENCVVMCDDCGQPSWEDDAVDTNDDHGPVCESCSDGYTGCWHCEYRYLDDTISWYGSLTVCPGCWEEHYTYCDVCDETYPADRDHSHPEDCGCESPAMSFRVRNDGHGWLANDTPTTVTLPKGVISDAGIGQIGYYLRRQAALEQGALSTDDLPPEKRAYINGLYRLAYDLPTLGTTWQQKDGNYTKRLSRHAYKNHSIKLPPHIMSEVGNIGVAHSGEVAFEIEVTRNLNLSREEFANEESCWWTEYASSRCALKSNGGFGIRSFGEMQRWGRPVTGRAWVMPLKTSGSRLLPTFETEQPAAFVVFNCYGDLENYAAARAVAHMAGMTYRRIEFGSEPMYINSGTGYLVAPEEIAETYTDGRIDFDLDAHANLYDNESRACLAEMEMAHA